MKHDIKTPRLARRFLAALAILAALPPLALAPALATPAPVAPTPAQAAPPQKAAQQQVNIYSYRQPFLIAPIFARFSQQTGIEVKVIFAKKGLIERVAAEGKRSPADVILTTDIGKLKQAAQLAQPVRSKILTKYIPAQARGAYHKWFGLTWRARIAYVSKSRVPQPPTSYAELADKKWRGRICTRSGQHPYNNALFAALLAHWGPARFTTWLAALKANLAAKPSGNDRAQVRRIYGGSCDIAIGNSYYMGKMQTNEKNPEQQKWAASVRPIFLAMPEGGAHVNVSGMVMARYAPHPKNARKLMEFLVSADAQQLYASTNFEYPIRADIAVAPLVASWGRLLRDPLPMDKIAAQTVAASRIVDKVGFNTAP